MLDDAVVFEFLVMLLLAQRPLGDLNNQIAISNI